MLTEAALLREVARVQHDKTLLAVRDLVEGIATTKPSGSYRHDERTAKDFRRDLLRALERLKETE